MKSKNLSSYVAKFSDNIGALFIVIMMLLISAEVIMRSVFGTSTLISDEYSGYLMVFVTYWGAASAFHAGSFVRVEAIFERFPQKVKRVLNIIYEFLFFVFNSYMCYYFFQSLAKVFNHQSVSASISRTPLWIPYGICWLGILMFEVYLILAFVENVIPKKEEK